MVVELLRLMFSPYYVFLPSILLSGKPLGERGLEWLKIHLVNQTGFQKRESNKDRLEYANNNLERIFQSAETPFEVG